MHFTWFAKTFLWKYRFEVSLSFVTGMNWAYTMRERHWMSWLSRETKWNMPTNMKLGMVVGLLTDLFREHFGAKEPKPTFCLISSCKVYSFVVNSRRIHGCVMFGLHSLYLNSKTNVSCMRNLVNIYSWTSVYKDDIYLRGHGLRLFFLFPRIYKIFMSITDIVVTWHKSLG